MAERGAALRRTGWVGVEIDHYWSVALETVCANGIDLLFFGAHPDLRLTRIGKHPALALPQHVAHREKFGTIMGRG